jgi:hypothetical protein
MSMSERLLLRRFARAWTLLALALLTLGTVSAEEAAEHDVIDPPGRVARLSHFDGEVLHSPAETDEWAEALRNRPLTSGDRLWTESGARAELQVGAAALYLDERTSFGFVILDDERMHMSLTEGALTVQVRRRAEHEQIRIETPNVAVELREPGEYHLAVDSQTDRTIVETRHGAAEAFGDGVTQLVRAEERGIFAGLEPLAVRIEPLGPRNEFERWALEREQRAVQARSTEYVSQDVVGYEDLDPYGDWHHEPEYGYVWRPRYVALDWAPYRDGRWVWVAPWGWTWVDHAPWGFAPFHYGRWAYVRERWCWVPGPKHYRPVYAPALVGWLGSPHMSVSVSFGNVGWFPLAPREIYIPAYRHSPRYIRHVNVSNTIIINHAHFTAVYSARHRDFDYRYRTHPRAVTAVQHGRFIGGRPVLGRILRVDERELSQWRPQARPPALAPDRASILAGSIRQPPQLHRLDDRRNVRPAARVGGDSERRFTHGNTGRRSEPLLSDPPKQRGDFNPRGRRQPRSATPEVTRQSFAPQGRRIESLPARESTLGTRSNIEPIRRDRRDNDRSSERAPVPRASLAPSTSPQRSPAVTPTTPRRTIPSSPRSEPRLTGPTENRGRSAGTVAPASRPTMPARVDSSDPGNNRGNTVRTPAPKPVERQATPRGNTPRDGGAARLPRGDRHR